MRGDGGEEKRHEGKEGDMRKGFQAGWEPQLRWGKYILASTWIQGIMKAKIDISLDFQKGI